MRITEIHVENCSLWKLVTHQAVLSQGEFGSGSPQLLLHSSFLTQTSLWLWHRPWVCQALQSVTRLLASGGNVYRELRFEFPYSFIILFRLIIREIFGNFFSLKLKKKKKTSSSRDFLITFSCLIFFFFNSANLKMKESCSHIQQDFWLFP